MGRYNNMAPIVASPLISVPCPNLFLDSDEKIFLMDGLIKYNAKRELDINISNVGILDKLLAIFSNRNENL